MPRLSIADLPQPSAAYLITQVPAPPPDAMGYERGTFETKAFAARQDELRANRCDAAQSLLTRKRLVRCLARKLRSLRVPRTLASSRRWRRLRIRIIGAVWKLVVEGPWDPAQPDQVAVFSITPRSWELTAAELDQVRGEQLLARLAAWLKRKGAAQADGWLIACLHGEFEPTRGIYRVHVHGVAVGGMIAVVNRLRQLPDLDSALDPPDGREGTSPRVVLSRKPLSNLPHALSYQFKGWWPSRWIGFVKRTGKVERARWAARIRNPEHTELLLWLDRHELSDITLLMKVRVGKQGLVPTQPPKRDAQIGKA